MDRGPGLLCLSDTDKVPPFPYRLTIGRDNPVQESQPRPRPLPVRVAHGAHIREVIGQESSERLSDPWQCADEAIKGEEGHDPAQHVENRIRGLGASSHPSFPFF